MTWLSRAWSWLSGHVAWLAGAAIAFLAGLVLLFRGKARREGARADRNEAAAKSASASAERERTLGEDVRRIEADGLAERERITAGSILAEKQALAEAQARLAMIEASERALKAQGDELDKRLEASFTKTGSAAAEAKRRMQEGEKKP